MSTIDERAGPLIWTGMTIWADPGSQPIGGADQPGRAEEDDVLDGWLASLEPGELERFLSHLADTPADLTAALDPTA